MLSMPPEGCGNISPGYENATVPIKGLAIQLGKELHLIFILFYF